MKKTLIALLILLAAALVFTGCPKEPAAPNPPTTWDPDPYDGPEYLVFKKQ